MRLFISYAHADRFLVNLLVEILRNAGLDPWFDHRLTVGRDWKEQLREAITQCEAFVYALSPESVASEWCQWEFVEAVRQGKPIIPVLIQANTVLPDALSRYQYADFTEGPTPDGVARLMAALWQVRVVVPTSSIQSIPVSPSGFPAQAQPDQPEIPPDTREAENTIVRNALEVLVKQMCDFGIGSIDGYCYRCGSVYCCTWISRFGNDYILLFYIEIDRPLSEFMATKLLLNDWQHGILNINRKGVHYFAKYWGVEDSITSSFKSDSRVEDIVNNVVYFNTLDDNRLTGRSVMHIRNLEQALGIDFTIKAPFLRLIAEDLDLDVD